MIGPSITPTLIRWIRFLTSILLCAFLFVDLHPYHIPTIKKEKKKKVLCLRIIIQQHRGGKSKSNLSIPQTFTLLFFFPLRSQYLR